MRVTVLLLVLAALAWLGARDSDEPNEAARRLIRYVRRDEDSEVRRSIFARADRYVLRVPLGAALGRHLAQAGVSAPISALLLRAGAGICAAAAAAGAARGPFAAASTVAAGIFAGHAVLRAARGRRIRRMEAQLPGALDMLVGQLRSHRSIGEAISDVAGWTGGPLGRECERVAEELRMGVPLPRAFERLRERVPAPAVPAIVTAILVAYRTGANLTECLTRQAAASRAQIAFRQEVGAMTAHARMTGATLALLPVVVACAMALLDPGVFEPMVGTTPGRVLLAAACAMECVGWLAVRWMIRRVDA